MCIYPSFRQDGGTQVLRFTKLKIALSSVALSVERIKGIQKRFLIILCQLKAYTIGFIEDMAKQRTGIIDLVGIITIGPASSSCLGGAGAPQAF